LAIFSAGNIVNHLDYDSFGNITTETHPELGLPLIWSGLIYDRATNTYRAHYRVYDPTTGRWLSEDPIGFRGGLTSLSDYVGNDPVNYFDPQGLQKAAPNSPAIYEQYRPHSVMSPNTAPAPAPSRPAAPAVGIGPVMPVVQMAIINGMMHDPQFNPAFTNMWARHNLTRRYTGSLTEEEIDYLSNEFQPGTYPIFELVNRVVERYWNTLKEREKHLGGLIDTELEKYANNFAAIKKVESQIRAQIAECLDSAKNNKDCKDGLDFISHFDIYEQVPKFPGRERHHLNQQAVWLR